MNEKYSILIDDNVYFVHLVNKKIRTIRIRVENDIIFVSGNNISKEKAFDLINKHLNWVKKQLYKYQKKLDEFPIEEINSFKKTLIYGDIKNIIFINDKTYSIDNNIFKITKKYLDNNDLRIQELKKIRVNYLNILKERVAYFSHVFNRYPICTYKDMKSKYGYCKYKENSLCFSTRLIHLPVELIDYIIVHEFCHFAVPNHSKDFYKEVNKYYSNYRNAIKELKKYNFICK